MRYPKPLANIKSVQCKTMFILFDMLFLTYVLETQFSSLDASSLDFDDFASNLKTTFEWQPLARRNKIKSLSLLTVRTPFHKTAATWSRRVGSGT